jgi:hypothetical protein
MESITLVAESKKCGTVITTLLDATAFKNDTSNCNKLTIGRLGFFKPF